jgi:ABC-type hemin transport system substrate-binding protein
MTIMTIAEIISALQEGNDVVVRDKTFHPRSVETVILDTGDFFWFIP